jgi:MSHA biogenesis protein MshL
MALVSGTRYSMLVAPDVTGNISVNLKDVTVAEALDTIRELYGYEYRIQGRRIFIEPNTMKSRVFQINYLSSRRQGSSDLRVSGSSMTAASTATTPGATPTTTPASTTTTTTTRANDASRVSMTTDSDFWGDLQKALLAIIGTADGRSVVINPSSGVVVIRGLPGELRNADKYLRATQLIAERQVMLEAKIIDVSLSEEFQAGVNWAIFGKGPNSRSGMGVAAPGTTLNTLGSRTVTSTVLTNPATGAIVPYSTSVTSTSDTVNPSPSVITATSGSGALSTKAGDSFLPGALGALAAASSGKGLIGLAFQTSNFAALLNFLETQGQVSVLSSPRIATLNNQKAVLKVGTDELFVTNVTSQTTTSTTGTVATPSLTLQPYFSGISLDVTPQIDEEGNIILHVHPAVSTVQEKEKVIDLGTLGVYKLPLASSSINETDSIVRVPDGAIVAIGGLMRQEQSGDRSGLPGAGNNPLLGQRGALLRKRELVILIKPTVIRDDRAWADDLKGTQQRVEEFNRPAPPSADSQN